ncbi:MAG: HEAT repeat domain-containing protein [Chloroflexi bacterium]|nr:HEAT repeat domain-containing protein [Chloroflexota bacterium]
MTFLRNSLKLHAGEERMALLIIGVMIFTSAGSSIGSNGIEALFFARFGVQYLPYMYMALGVITLITSLAITALLGRVAREKLYIALPIALALLLIGGRVVIALELNWFYPILWLGKEVMNTLIGLLSWGLAGFVCDTRQAKRLFPIFGAGRILGSVIGGFGTQSLAAWLHTENLLLVWAGAMMISFVCSRALLENVPKVSNLRDVEGKQTVAELIQEMQKGFQFVQRSPLMRWVSIAAILFSILYFSVALPFSKSATEEFVSEEAIAGFLGLFQGISTAAAFLASLFLANRLFTRFGIMSMILALPIIYLIGFGALAVFNIFVALVAFRFVQMLWLAGIADSAYQAMFNAVPSEKRDQVRTFIGGVPEQAGTFIAGLVLVIGEQSMQSQSLYVIGLITAAMTTFVIWRSSRAYSGALVEALRAGQPSLFFNEEKIFQGDAEAINAAIHGVADSDSIIRRVSAEILGNIATPNAVSTLINALKDSDPDVRSASLRGLAHAKASSTLLEVSAMLLDSESSVRLQAIESLRELAGNTWGMIAHIQPLLEDSSSAVRARAASTLLRVTTHDGAKNMLRQMAAMGETQERVDALHALGDWGDAEAFELICVELEDEGTPPIVRSAAATAIIRTNSIRSIEPLIRALSDFDTIVRESDPLRERGALIVLEHLPVLQVSESIRNYAKDTAMKAVHYHDLPSDITLDNDRLHLLADSIHDKAHYYGVNALRALGLLRDHESISIAIQNLKSREMSQRAYALETLESLGETEIVKPLLKLWESGEGESGAVAAHAQKKVDLTKLLHDEDSWLRACAVFASSPNDPIKLLAETDPDPFVRATAESILNGDAMKTLATLSMMERILFLRRVPLFGELDSTDLKQVASISIERIYSDGAMIATQGEMGEEMYVIASGEVCVKVAEKEVARRRTGDCVGEMAIISREPRIASLIALGEVRTLCLDRQRFEGLLRERPETCLAVMKVLCDRLKELSR